MSSEGSASMNGDDNGENELSKEDKEVEDGDMGERQSSFKEDELKVDGVDGDESNGGERGSQDQDVLQVQQQQAQGTAVGWERFLHVRSVKVLLVENDDSTRHVVTALLRNCNYEVIEASNGWQAWKILEDLTNHVDLVLTEVVMPGLSGIGLLCKIMSHKTRKNIPVIMMSSHDSMGLVFKCLSKGAVDFLVKPIRKNELKNLWQHVWRRCHSSSGSGSESGTQTQKSIKSKSSEKSGNNSGSNTGEDNGSNGLNAGDGSDDGSGTQSSWTKQPIEVDSSPAWSPVDQIAECPDSTCAQVIHSNAETSANKRVQMTANRKHEEEQQPEVNDLVTGEPVNLEGEHENTMEDPVKHIGVKQTIPLETDPGTSSKRIDKGHEYPSGENPSNNHYVVCIATSDPQTESKEFDASRELTNRLERRNSANDDSKETLVDLSLKRLRGVQDSGKGVQDDLNILRHSELSAFSRYNASSSAFRTPNGVTGSSTVIDSGQEGARKDATFITQNHSNENPQYPSLKGISNDIDMGSTTNKLPTSPLIFLSEATSTINGLHASSAFKPVKNDLRCNPQQVSGAMPSDMKSTALLGPAGSSHQDLQIQHPHHNHRQNHHHYHHHHHHHQNNHFHSFEQLHLMFNHDDLSLRKLTADAPHCGSSNVLSRPSEEIPLNYSLNRSASGSNYVSNGHNGSSTAANAGGTNGESDIGLPLQTGSGDANGSRDGNRIDQNRLSKREAAVTKYRQKRKERCFKRKVRYQNRKRLADLRPRVRGQFVRQPVPESSNDETDE